MKYESMLLINDIERMSDSLIKLLKATNDDFEVPHDHALMLKGIIEIREGTAKVVNSLNI